VLGKQTVNHILSQIKVSSIFVGKNDMEKTKEGVRSLSRTEGLEHMENYYQSGLRPSEYYHRHGISKDQFFYWYRRYSGVHSGGELPSGTEKKFHPVKIEYAPDIRVSGLEIRYPNGVAVIISDDRPIEIDKLSALIKLRV